MASVNLAFRRRPGGLAALRRASSGVGGGVADPYVDPQAEDAGKANRYSATLTQHARRQTRVVLPSTCEHSVSLATSFGRVRLATALVDSRERWLRATRARGNNRLETPQQQRRRFSPLGWESCS